MRQEGTLYERIACKINGADKLNQARMAASKFEMHEDFIFAVYLDFSLTLMGARCKMIPLVSVQMACAILVKLAWDVMSVLLKRLSNSLD